MNNTFKARAISKDGALKNIKPPWRIALMANLKEENPQKESEDEPPDYGAEFDRVETIEAIAEALEAEGHFVHFAPADQTLPKTLLNLRPNICFNIAEGIGGDGREAQAPALCELLGIPYTGSRVVANALSLDKTKTKRIWAQMGLPTAPFYEIRSLADLDQLDIEFPLFAKPAREGTGMGIDHRALITHRAALEERVAYLLEKYRQPVLVEAFLPGREFTVGFIGNPGDASSRRIPQLYDAEGYHWFPVLEIDTHTSVSPGVYGHDAKALNLDQQGAPHYLCPANIPDSLRTQLITITKKAAQALDVCDMGRVDFRLDANGQPFLLEINTLPGLNPQVSDLCIMARAEGLPYQLLISEILYLAAERYGMHFGAPSTTPEQGAAEKVRTFTLAPHLAKTCPSGC